VNYVGKIYTVSNPVTNKLEDIHISNICPFEYDPVIVDPRQVANIDIEVVYIDEITSNTGNPKRRAHMTLLTQWSDVDETWEPWSNVGRTEEACGMK